MEQIQSLKHTEHVAETQE